MIIQTNIIYTDTLKAGDLVSIFPLEGNQLFIITDKLVKFMSDTFPFIGNTIQNNSISNLPLFIEYA